MSFQSVSPAVLDGLQLFFIETEVVSHFVKDRVSDLAQQTTTIRRDVLDVPLEKENLIGKVR